MSHLGGGGGGFHIWYKMDDLFWYVRDRTSKLPTYPTCQLAPLSPNGDSIGVLVFDVLVKRQCCRYGRKSLDNNSILNQIQIKLDLNIYFQMLFTFVIKYNFINLYSCITFVNFSYLSSVQHQVRVYHLFQI